MDKTSSESRKRKAEDEMSSDDSAGFHNSLRRRTRDTYQLAGKLDNLSLFKMAVAQPKNGQRIMDRSVVSLLMDAIRSRPKPWHARWHTAEKRLQMWNSQEKAICAEKVYDCISGSLNELDDDVGDIQEASIKAPEESIQAWWRQQDAEGLWLRLRDLGSVDGTVLDQAPVNLKLSRVVEQISLLDELGPNAVGEDTFWNPPIDEDKFGESDEAASALRYQMLRLILFYEHHDKYLQFFRRIVHDLKSIVLG
ncbi:hypothetical protein CC79DRAFT_1363792 [Sarocladium strictum]